MPSLGFWDLLLVLGVVTLLFGAKRIPDIARGLGSGIRNFKGSLKSGSQDDSEDAGDA